jgi:hypothetical protein
MKSRDFCYWLQGFFEVQEAGRGERQLGGRDLSNEQVLCIQRHLNMVFKHEIDPSNGTPEHNLDLSKIHRGVETC